MVVNHLNIVPMMVEVSLIPGKQLYFKTVSSWNCSASVKTKFHRDSFGRHYDDDNDDDNDDKDDDDNDDDNNKYDGDDDG